ncbi:MAG: CinA family protein [Chloroflexi bacterium]|nr:CinA family protein [Chloroflexota bacterium]
MTATDKGNLEVVIGEILRDQQLTLTCAESCTGGLLMHRFTEVPGSSSYFLGGVVAYNNGVKHALLGVQEDVLVEFGAVSEQTAIAMARGVRALLGAHLALSITGVAGPGGGTAEKPVGLTYIGLDFRGRVMVQRHVWQGDRSANKHVSAEAALQMLYDQLQAG